MKTRSFLPDALVCFLAHPVRTRLAAPLSPARLALFCTLAILAAGTLRTQATPTRSTPIALSASNVLVSVNPDANTISVFDASAATPVKLGEVVVGREPSSVAILPNGATAFVANAADGTVSVVDLATRQQVASVSVGAEPMALALSPNGTRLYVANSASGSLMVFNTATLTPTLLATVDLSAFGTAPRAIAVTDNGDANDADETIFVTLFYAQLRPGKTFTEEGQDDQKEGRVVAISAATSTVLSAVTVGPLANTGFNSDGQLAPAPGQVPAVPSTNPQAFTTPTAAFPNQLAGLAIHPTDQTRAYIVSTAASPNGPVRFNQNVQGLVSVFNTGTRNEITAAQTDPAVRRTAPLNLNQGLNLATTPAPRLFHSNPTAIAWRPDGSDAWITVQQSDLLLRMAVDANGIPTISAPLVAGPSTIVRVDLQTGAIPGKAPRGLVINAAGTLAYVLNYVSRSISVVDISNPTSPSIAASVQASALPASNTPDATAQLGAEMFFSGRGPNGRLASEAWGSCAACHPNGRSDNVTWMFDTGPRQTIALDGTFGPTHQKSFQRVLNWSGVRDEVHDFELNSRNISGGRGLIDDDRLFLAFGGASGANPTDSSLVEQFHQFTGAVGTVNDLTGQAIPSLPSARRDFAIATLGDDRVFIIGGRTGGGPGALVTDANTVLEFNPGNNSFQARSATGFTPRHSLGAAAVRTSAGWRIYAIGGYASTSVTESPAATVEEYNPATDTWRTVASLPTAVAQFGITVAGGISTAEPLQLIHVVAGNTGSEAAPSVANPNPVQRFQPDPAGPGTWSAFAVPGLTLRRNHGVATALRGVSSRVFVIGGQDAAGTVLDTVEEYLAQAVVAVATPHTALPTARARFGIAGSLSTQQIYVIGGVDGTGAAQTTVLEYSLANNGPTAGPPGTPSGAWVTRGNLSAARSGLQVSTPPGVVNFLPFANTGRSVTQDALAEFVRLRLRPARAPVPASDPGAQAGRTLFGTVGLVQPGISCATCHGGANWTRSVVDFTAPPSAEIGLGLGNQRVIGAELRQTASQNPAFPAAGQAPGVLINVGTFTLGGGRVNEIRFNAADISQAIAPLGANGFNVPSLLSVHETGPYFYSGLAQTLNEVLDGSKDGNGGTQQHFVPNATQRAQLVAFLRSIDDTTPSFPGAPGDTIVNCSSNLVVECTGGLTPVSFTVTATNANGPVPVTCVPPSGTGFRIGTSNVVCTASGATNPCNFTVTVVDTTPPRVDASLVLPIQSNNVCGLTISVQATSAAGVDVNYIGSAFDACGLGFFNCSPPGGTFPIGLTTVTCQATDSVGNSNSCSFTVSVNDLRPVIACPTNLVVECTGGLTPVTFTVTATNANGPVPITCVPPSGTGFRIGTSNVVCTASGAASPCNFTVTVVDTTPPTVNASLVLPIQSNNVCGLTISVQATSAAGVVVNYIGSAFDACGLGFFNCSPPGGTFPIGLTTVTCQATDSVGNSNSCSFTVAVNDLRPVIACPTNLVAECTGGLTPVTFTVTATNANGPVPVTCVPPSGTGFRLGTSNVVCTADGSTVSCSFTVTVVDTTPPRVTCPGDITITTTNAAGAAVTYTASASDACGIASFNCSPLSGSVFPIGSTTVICTASDGSGNTNSCSFTVSVQGARGLKEGVLADMIALRATVTDEDDGEELDEAIEELTESLDPSLWVDQNHLDRKHGDKVFDEEKDSAKELCELIDDNHSHLSVATLQDFIDRMFQADRLLASIAIEEAAAAGVAKKKLDQARQELAKGDAAAADSKCGNGIEHYRNAWKLAVRSKTSPPAHLVNGQHQMEVLGEPGERLTIQGSVNMADWVTLGTCTLDGEGVATFVDTDTTHYPVRYYRILKQ